MEQDVDGVIGGRVEFAEGVGEGVGDGLERAVEVGLGGGVGIGEGPEGFGEPAFNERMPASAGFIQLSICEAAGVEGVTCVPPN